MSKSNPIIAQRCDFAVGDVIDGRWKVLAFWVRVHTVRSFA